MPFCPNCGTEVKAEYFYCGSCGYPLTDEVDDDTERIPPSGTAASQQGFLSGRSRQYLNAVAAGDQELDPDTAGYANLSRDIGAALADFARVATVNDLNLFKIVLDRMSGSDVLEKDVETLNRWQVEERLMWFGIWRLPRLYDTSFGTEMEAALADRLTTILENVEDLKESDH